MNRIKVCQQGGRLGHQAAGRREPPALALPGVPDMWTPPHLSEKPFEKKFSQQNPKCNLEKPAVALPRHLDNQKTMRCNADL